MSLKKSPWETVFYKSSNPVYDNSYFSDLTQRMKVSGGWIIETIHQDSDGICSSICFSPDINHEWKLEK